MKDFHLEELFRIFISISNETTFPLFTFLSAGIVNIFVPSGGGQWAVQAPIMIPAGAELGVPAAKQQWPLRGAMLGQI